jgi:RNA polymerase sigma-70 factor (ECF subfamily)
MNQRSIQTDYRMWVESLRAARDGSREALGELLEACRKYLMLVANKELNDQLRPKAGASDLVQQTFLEAQRDFAQFKGASEVELRGWLRQMLRHNIANCARSYRDTEMRQVNREISFDDAARAEMARALVTPSPSPCSRAIRNEQVELLERALERLPEEYRQVIILRNRERLEFREIGHRLGRLPDTVRWLWVKAVESLRQELKGT